MAVRYIWLPIFNKCNYSKLFHSPVQIRIKYILRCIVVKAAVVVVNFIAHKRIIRFKQGIDYVTTNDPEKAKAL